MLIGNEITGREEPRAGELNVLKGLDGTEMAFEVTGCYTFPEQGSCLLANYRETGVCDVCETLEAWKAEGHAVVLLREIRQGRGLHLEKGSPEKLTSDQRWKYVMQLRFDEMSSLDIRKHIQTYLGVADEVWIELPRCSVRLR